MDHNKLERLREAYGTGKADESPNSRFNQVAQAAFSEPGERYQPYAGIPTLLDMPYREGESALDDLDIALIGVPTDIGVTNRPGARFGPRALRAIERVGPYNHVLDVLPSEHHRIADIGDVGFRSRYMLDMVMEDIESYFAKVVGAGVRTLAAGGDHSITYPILRAVGRDRPVGLVHIDAHCDTMGEMDCTKFHHGGPFRYAVLDGVLDPDLCVQIGIRGASEYLWEFSYDSGMTVIHAEDVDRLGVDAVIAKAREVVGDAPVYVSLDVDGIDPAFAPGTGTPEVGGLTPREVQAILRGCKGLSVVGGDVVEVAPEYDPGSVTAQVGAQMMLEILCLMVLADSRDSA